MKRRSWLERATAVALLAGCGPDEVIDPAPRCGDCTLREAAALAAIRVGVAAAPTDPARAALIVSEFDALSPEGELVWKVVHPEPDSWDLGPAEAILDFAADNDLDTTVSHFVWAQATAVTGTPDWVLAIDDPETLRAVMRAHLRELDERFGDRIDRWITVNEPLDYFGSVGLYQNHFYDVLGSDYVAETFTLARSEAPHAELWLNEIFTESSPAKCDALVALAADLVDRGVPIDGVGIQGHLFPGVPDLALVEDTLRRLGELGLKVALTELDAPTSEQDGDRDAVQSERLAGMVRACLAVPACEAVTFWGLEDKASWLEWLLEPGTRPLLFDDELRPKPAYFAVRDALAAGRP